MNGPSSGTANNTLNRHRSLTTTSIYILCISMSIRFRRPETLSSHSSEEFSLDEHEVVSPKLGSALCCVPCFEAFGSQDKLMEGDAFDVIVVESEDHKLYQDSEFLVSFPSAVQPSHTIVLEVRGGESSSETSNKTTARSSPTTWFPIIRRDDSSEMRDVNHDGGDSLPWNCCQPSMTPGKIMDLNGTVDDIDITSKLAPLLKPGKNPIRYLLLDQDKVLGVAHANIFLWSHRDSIVVSDIDGTITKSNARGVIDTIFTENYQYCHEGICNLLSNLAEHPNTQIMYVTSRPIGLASHTRKFLANLRQGEAGLPDGPMLGFGGNVPQLLIMELVSMSTHRFKAEMLWKQVVQPFRKVVNASSSTPIFLAGLGNTLMDVQAYHMAGIEMDKIYLINKKSRISAFDKKVDKEWKNMTSSSGRLLSPAVGTAMPRRWYKTKMRSSFEGYSDPRLLSRVMPQQNISEYSGEVGLT